MENESIIKDYPKIDDKKINNTNDDNRQNTSNQEFKKNFFGENNILRDIEIILPGYNNSTTSKSLINSFELAVYKNQIENISLNINSYLDSRDLENIILLKAKPGKIFVGTFGEEETKIVKNHCDKGILFFSFSSNIDLAGECVYLINFFPSDDIRTLFNFFPKESKIALLYPEDFYGFTINNIIDDIAKKSQSLIINRASYKKDLSDARNAIKELGKYELRKLELERQKSILKDKKDKISLQALKKIQKFETIGEVDFTHIIIPDYGIRLLEIAPLLPFYDIDPQKVQFVGTGTWDDSVFFNEPSLQGAIFPGVEEKKRSKFFEDYYYIYKEKPMRTSTIPYDLVGLLSYLINKKYNLSEVFEFLDNSKIKFDGIDGKFYFENNIIVGI
mgnify:CR=1 FL=1